MPDAHYHPQLATLVHTPPDGAEWLHEIKLDGYRIGCRIHAGRVTLFTRNGHDWTKTFPDVAAAASRLDVRDAMLDGEVVVLLPDGRASFQALQGVLSGSAAGTRPVYFVFDLLRLEGKSLEQLPLEERKARLRSLVGGRQRGTIRYTEHVDGHGRAFLGEACRLGLEGIISKRRDLPYSAGRQDGWLKSKCLQRQEFVIGGFTDPEGTRAGIGALLVGHYDSGRLVYSGRVGTGFTQRGAVELRARLDAIEQKTAPFDPPPAASLSKGAHWVRPTLVCEATFSEWTNEGYLRQPSFQGLRSDKPPRDVVRERAVEVSSCEMAPPTRASRTAASPRTKPSRASATPPRTAAPAKTQSGRLEVAGIGISHPERVLYPDPPFTKLDLVQYYEAVADWMLPHVVGRPLTLLRCPDGMGPSCFYMKHSHVSAPAALRRVKIHDGTAIKDFLVVDDLAGLVSLAQMNVLEIHTWNSVVSDLERPDRVVFDLDPGEEVEWATLVETALNVRGVLEALDLESYPKTTGGKGLHVVVPLRPRAGWPECLEFTRALSERIARADPDRCTIGFAKAPRKRKILIDFVRNSRTSTSVAAFSTRARAGAPVGVPLRWTDLSHTPGSAAFTATTLPARLARLRTDPWKGYWTSRQSLTADHLRAAAGR